MAEPMIAPLQPPTPSAKAERKRKTRVRPSVLTATEAEPDTRPPIALAAPAAEAAPPVTVAPLAKVAEIPGSVTLRARNGLCYPSLDRDGPTQDTLTRQQVPPGKHDVYCSLDKTGPRQLVGKIEVRPGKSVEKAIVVENGKPRFADAR